jgi:hypothetical protein
MIRQNLCKVISFLALNVLPVIAVLGTIPLSVSPTRLTVPVDWPLAALVEYGACESSAEDI